ncbi:PLAT/LH2 domain-containing protein, partial [Salmonella sp. s57402]
MKYECDFDIPDDFGEIGAVLVENEHHTEMFLANISIDGFITGPVNLTCNSWVSSKAKSTYKRIFFNNKSYLPSQTPCGLKRWRA